MTTAAAPTLIGTDPTPVRTAASGMKLSTVLRATLFDVGLSIGLFMVAKNLGGSDVQAYLVACLAPLTAIAVGLIRTRRVTVMPLVVLGWTVFGVVLSLVGPQDPRTLLIKDSVITGAVGLAFLVTSLPACRRPLLFWFGLRYSTDGSLEAEQGWHHRFTSEPAFRRSQYVLNTVWGAGLLAEAFLRVALVLVLPFTAAFTATQVLPLAVIGVLILWTRHFISTRRRAAAQVVS